MVAVAQIHRKWKIAGIQYLVPATQNLEKWKFLYDRQTRPP